MAGRLPNIHQSLSVNQITLIREFLVSKFPKHALIVRTLNEKTDTTYIQNLITENFRLIGSRQVYLIDNNALEKFTLKKPRDVKKDEYLLTDKDITIINYEKKSLIIDEQIQQLYHNLYLEKHSSLNPDYTTQFFSLIQSTPGFKTKLIYNNQQLIGFLGYMVKNEIIYAPFLGYNPQNPENKDSYRMISAIKIQAAQKGGWTLHSSAGASSFKLNRGHSPVIEYHALYIRKRQTNPIYTTQLT